MLECTQGHNWQKLQSQTTKSKFITDNGCISDSVMIANEFNDFFVSIGDKLASKITSNINPLSFVNNIPNSMVMSEVSPNEVLQIIHSLKNSSPGWDDIPTSMAKQCVNNFIEPLTYLINKSFSSGIFPIELKLLKWSHYTNLGIRALFLITDQYQF